VVVASADGRTPAVTFAPDADPFSAGGLFAPAGGRDGEPSVVVHPAPDAAVTRPVRRPRPLAPAGARRSDASADGSVDGALDTGSLVRPYVHDLQPDVQPDVQPAPELDIRPETWVEVWADSQAPVPVEPAPPVLPRRSRRAGGPLDRIIEPAPSAGEWSAPWSRESEADEAGRSLFEPAPRREPEGVWSPPREQALPSRKALRAQERAGSAPRMLPGLGGSELAGRTTGRRIAKSGVLAVTAIGVVAASAPNAFPALGWHLPARPVAPGAQTALAGLPAADALAVAPEFAVPSDGPADSTADLAAAARYAQAAQAQAKADQAQAKAAAARAGAAATGTGASFVEVARQQVLAEAARKHAQTESASRNVLRDPRSYAKLLVQQRGWSAAQFTCLNLLWTKESGWDYRAMNRSSGAYGIPQALPGSKMGTVASDWRTNPITQIKWGLNYIAAVYGTPCNAWGHSQRTNWY
jgi:hypothetical protein